MAGRNNTAWSGVRHAALDLTSTWMSESGVAGEEMQQGGGAPLRCCHRAAALQGCRSASCGLRGQHILHVRNRAGCPEAPSWTAAAGAGTGCTAMPCTGPRFMTLCGARIRHRLWTAHKCGVRHFEPAVGAIRSHRTGHQRVWFKPRPSIETAPQLSAALRSPRTHTLTLSDERL